MRDTNFSPFLQLVGKCVLTAPSENWDTTSCVHPLHYLLSERRVAPCSLSAIFRPYRRLDLLLILPQCSKSSMKILEIPTFFFQSCCRLQVYLLGTFFLFCKKFWFLTKFKFFDQTVLKSIKTLHTLHIIRLHSFFYTNANFF